MARQAMADMSERVIELDRKDLLAKLRENKEKHIREYDEAIAAYKDVAKEKLNKALEKARHRLEKNHQEMIKRIDDFDVEELSDYLVLVNEETVQLVKPRNYADKYDAAIDMVSWDVRDTLELSQSEFQCFVRDKWDWSDNFLKMSAMYKVRK